MPRAFALAFASFAVCFFALASGVAHAAPPATQTTPIAVLTIWTDDADDAADALTQALRAQVRASPGWSLTEAAQSFETLAIALRCPAKPDAACLQRIGDQLHVTRYVWGTAAKHKGGGVDAEVHLWTRGRPAVDAAGTVADTVKDPNDPALRAVAQQVWDELAGPNPLGTLVVHAGAAGGTVVVDGDERETLRSGSARVPVSAGEHVVVVRVPGFRTTPQTTSVAGRAEREVDFALTAESTGGGTDVHVDDAAGAAGRDRRSGSGVPVKSIVGYTAIVVGVGLLVAAGVEAANWVSDKNASDRDRANVPNTVSQVCDFASSAAEDACKQGKNAKTASLLGWVFAGAGVVVAGTGTWLVLSDTSHSETSPGTATIRLVPEIGAQRQMLSLRVAF
jgi:hypothetical protein